jgi:hypothetical protein
MPQSTSMDARWTSYPFLYCVVFCFHIDTHIPSHTTSINLLSLPPLSSTHIHIAHPHQYHHQSSVNAPTPIHHHTMLLIMHTSCPPPLQLSVERRLSHSITLTHPFGLHCCTNTHSNKYLSVLTRTTLRLFTVMTINKALKYCQTVFLYLGLCHIC